LQQTIDPTLIAETNGTDKSILALLVPVRQRKTGNRTKRAKRAAACQRGSTPSLKGKKTMPKVPDFYSINEVQKPPANRVYHNNSACPPGRDIPANERRSGTGGYRLCKDCNERNDQGR
jgi:hypothetical protein